MISRVIDLAMIERMNNTSMAFRISSVMREVLPSSKGVSSMVSSSSDFDEFDFEEEFTKTYVISWDTLESFELKMI